MTRPRFGRGPGMACGICRAPKNVAAPWCFDCRVAIETMQALNHRVLRERLRLRSLEVDRLCAALGERI